MTTYTCPKCGLTFQGKLEMCPHCETIMNYPDTVYTCTSCKKPFKGKKENCPHCNMKMQYAEITPEQIKAKWAKQNEEKQLLESKEAKKTKRVIWITIGSVVALFAILFCWIFFSVPTAVERAKAEAEADSLLAGLQAAMDEIETSAPIDSLGIWQVATFVDDFGEPTDQSYVYNKYRIQGTFSNSATENSTLNVDFIITNMEKIAIQLFEYADNNPVKKGIENSYKIRVKYDPDETVEFKANNYSDRLTLNKTDSKTLSTILSGGGEIKFSILEVSKYSSVPSSYKFRIPNADGYDVAIRRLNE